MRSNLIICFALTCLTSMALAQTPPYQANSAEATLELDAVTSDGQTAAITASDVAITNNFNIASNVTSTMWEMVYSSQALVPGNAAPGAQTANGQLVNVDFSAPSLAYHNGAHEFSWQTFTTPMTGTYSYATPLTASCQAVFTNPAHADGYTFSQGVQIVKTDGGFSGVTDLSATATDDGTQTVTLTAPVTFYGTSYTDIHVATNGRVSFVNPDGDFSPSVTEAMTDDPFVGPWTDLLDPSSGGGYLFVSDDGAGNVSVVWDSMQHWNDNTVFVDATVSFISSGEVVIGGMSNVGGFGEEMFLGMSAGSSVTATDPGMVDYTAGVGTTLNGTDMIYRYTGTAAELAAPGISIITFTPNALMNYDWAAL